MPFSDEIQQAITTFLKKIGEDPNRKGLQKTPQRAATLFHKLFEGYTQDPTSILKTSIYSESLSNKQMICVDQIPFFSICEHHLVPFHGYVHIGYYPKDRIVGLSKFSKLVDALAHRLQQQERLTEEIANAIDQALSPLGIAVIIEAFHFCDYLTDAEKSNVKMKTVITKGCFEQSSDYLSHFFKLIGKS